MFKKNVFLLMIFLPACLVAQSSLCDKDPTRSQIFDLTTDSGEIRKETIVQESLVNYSNLWVPAKQNGRFVCSYVRLEMTIADDKLHISIMQ
jgi:hypothetical protein